MKPPAFQFYADDFVSGTIDLPTEEIGPYILLLCYQWQKHGIPNSPAIIRRICRVGPEYPLIELFKKFEVCPDGLLRNRRMEIEREKQSNYKALKQLAGKEGAKKRWQTHNSAIGLPIANGMANDSSPSPSPSPSPIKTVSAVAPAVVPSKPKETDEEWLSSLSADPTYQGINVQNEFGKMRNWCGQHRKKPSRARFINWLNRIERPMQGQESGPYGHLKILG